MITAFMGDATNILSFHGEVDVKDTVGYEVEWSIFKPQRSGQQVGVVSQYTEVNFTQLGNFGDF